MQIDIDPVQSVSTAPKTAYKYSRMLIILLLVLPMNLLCFTMWPAADLTLIGYGLCYRTSSTELR